MNIDKEDVVLFMEVQHKFFRIMVFLISESFDD